VKIAFCCTDKAYPLETWLREQGETVYTWWTDPGYSFHRFLWEEEPDCILSYNYAYIFPPDIVQRYRDRIINMHISYLPWNRGQNPNFWSWVEDTPKGVSIHYIDEGVDTGRIIAQKRITHFDGEDCELTLRCTYAQLQEEIQELFKWTWLKGGEPSPPAKGLRERVGSYHSQAAFDRVSSILQPEGWDITIEELKRRWRELKK
jgi:hypothetical protein